MGSRWEPGGGQVRWEPLVPTRSPLGRVSRRGIKVGTRLGSGKQAGPNVVPTWSPLAQLCPHVVHTWSPHGPHVVPNWSPHGPHVVPIVATWSPSCFRQGQCQQIHSTVLTRLTHGPARGWCCGSIYCVTLIIKPSLCLSLIEPSRGSGSSLCVVATS